MTGRRLAISLFAGFFTAGIVNAQEGGEGRLVSEASYSTLYGPTAAIGLEGTDILGSGIDAEAQFRGGERGSGMQLDIERSVALEELRAGDTPVLDFALSGEKIDWNFLPFSRTGIGTSVTLRAGLPGPFGYHAGGFLRWDDLDGLGEDVSPVIRADKGSSHAAGLVLGLSYETLEGAVRPTSGMSVRGTVRIAGLGGRKWTKAEFDADTFVPLGSRAVLEFGVTAGLVESYRGQDVSILDRAFLGGTAPRGFAFGGISPRDETTDDPLGGTRYLTATTQVMTPIGDRGFFIGLFMDTGANWHLPDVNEYVDDDSFYLRTSAGIALEWTTPVGRLQISFAEPIRYRDGDERQKLSVALTASF